MPWWLVNNGRMYWTKRFIWTREWFTTWEVTLSLCTVIMLAHTKALTSSAVTSSGSATIMECLPNSISNLFPLKIYHKSSCTMDIINLVETLVLKGNNFLQISEIIANLNFRDFSERNKRFLSHLSSKRTSGTHKKNSTDKECITFYEDLIFSFPSDSQLIRVFLDRFEEMKPLYRGNGNDQKIGRASCRERV